MNMRKHVITALAISLASLANVTASITVQTWYKLGEDGVGAGNLPTDSSGNARDFVNADANSGSDVTVETTSPPPGSSKYYLLDGNLTGFSDVGWDPPEDNVGIECWARSGDLSFDTFSTPGRVVWSTGHNQNGIGILYDDFGAGFVGVIGNVNYVGLPYQPANTNEWVHLAVVRDGGVTTFYVNGQAKTPIRTDTPIDSTVPFMGYGGTLSNFFGAIDDARIFTFQPGEFYINDLLFFQSTNSVPYVTGLKAAPDGFVLKLQDKATTVKATSISITLDGTAISPTVTQNAGVTTLAYTSTNLLGSASAHPINLIFTDSAGSTFTNALSLVVPVYTAVPPTYAVATGVDTSKPGFRVRPFQTVAAQPNSLAWTEDQLVGIYGPNIADLSGADAEGFYDAPTVINYSIEAGGGTERGDFQAPDFPDSPFPGIPGTTALTGNSSMEVITFLQFSAAGTYQMGVNSDDGFKVTTGLNPRDRFALTLGEFDGGRGASDTLFTIQISQAGIYPFRLIWENGNGELSGNQANCEWFTVKTDGTKVLINDTNSPVKAYRVGPLPPYVSRVSPGIGERGTLPGAVISVDLTDGTTQIKATSIQLGVNGSALAPPTTLAKTGAVTTVTLVPSAPFAISSLNTSELVWGDTGSFLTTNTWQFNVLDATLPSGVVTPVGSGDSTKPGFRVHTYQVDLGTANAATGQGIANEIPVANTLFLGLWGTNIADMSLAVDGEFVVTNMVNWNRDAGQGADIGIFQTPDYPDDPIPGIPGSTSSYENLACEVLTYVEFPTSGVFTMGVNSDDGFRVTVATNTGPDVGAVRVLTPANLAGNYLALATYSANGGAFGGPWPRPNPIVGPMVAADDGTTTNNLDTANAGDSYMFMASPVVNASQLKGNIAVARRGGGVAFAQKAKFCQDAGALAVILVDRSDLAGQWPWGMGGSDPSVTIPCIMIDWDVWAKLKDLVTTNASTTGVTLSLGDDNSPTLGQFDGGRGEGTPTLFSFFVPQAGVYPMRLLYFQGGGGANCEWFSVDKLGNQILVNDRSNPNAIKAYRARTVSAVTPTISIAVSGSNAVITFAGVLQAAPAVNGPYTDVDGATSPRTVAVSGATMKFWRARQ